MRMLAPSAIAWLACLWRLSSARSDRKSTRLNSSHSQISYAVFCLKKKKNVDKILDIITAISKDLFLDESYCLHCIYSHVDTLKELITISKLDAAELLIGNKQWYNL